MNTEISQGTWPGRRQAIKHNARRIAERGGIAAASVALLSSVLAPFGVGLIVGKVAAIVGPFVLAMAVRMGVIRLAREQARHRGRRTLLRWLHRVLWLLLLPAWTASPIPLLNIVALPAIVLAFTAATAGYAVWTVEREAADTPPHPLEWGVLIVAVSAGAALLLLVALTTVAVGFSVQWLSQFWSEFSG